MRNIESQPLESALERRRRLFDEVFADFDARGVGLRMADNSPRAALHDRWRDVPYVVRAKITPVE